MRNRPVSPIIAACACLLAPFTKLNTPLTPLTNWDSPFSFFLFLHDFSGNAPSVEWAPVPCKDEVISEKRTYPLLPTFLELVSKTVITRAFIFSPCFLFLFLQLLRSDHIVLGRQYESIFWLEIPHKGVIPSSDLQSHQVAFFEWARKALAIYLITVAASVWLGPNLCSVPINVSLASALCPIYLLTYLWPCLVADLFRSCLDKYCIWSSIITSVISLASCPNAGVTSILNEPMWSCRCVDAMPQTSVQTQWFSTRHSPVAKHDHILTMESFIIQEVCLQKRSCGL